MERVESPCIKACEMRGGLCIGCKRTIDEIAQWVDMTDVERSLVLERIAAREIKNSSNPQEVIKKITENR